MRAKMLVLAALVLVAGCFPVLLHVDKTGRVLIARQEGVFSHDLKSGKTELVAKRLKGDPAWARWSPDGTKVLVAEVLKEDSKTMLSVVNMTTREAKPLADLEATACALWSPDGKSVSAAEVGMGGTKIKVIAVESRQAKNLLTGALAMHAWLPDGRLLAIRTQETKDEENSSAKPGELVVVNPAGGAIKVVAAVRCDQSALMDVSPDGKWVLAVESQAKGESQEETATLVKISLADGSKKVIAVPEVRAAFWSPDGKRIMILKAAGEEANGEKSGASAMGIAVTDAEGGSLTSLVKSGVLHQSGDMGGPSFFPTWADHETILYFVSAKTYGLGGTAVHLVSVKVDGSARNDLQMAIDNGVAQGLAAKAP